MFKTLLAAAAVTILTFGTADAFQYSEKSASGSGVFGIGSGAVSAGGTQGGTQTGTLGNGLATHSTNSGAAGEAGGFAGFNGGCACDHSVETGGFQINEGFSESAGDRKSNV